MIELKAVETFEHTLGDGPAPRPRRGGARWTEANLVYIRVHGRSEWTVMVRDTTLGVLDASNPERPVLLGTLELPNQLGGHFGEFRIQFIDDALYIHDRRGYLIVDVADPNAPSLRYALTSDTQRASSWFTSDAVYFFYYLNRGVDPPQYRVKNGSTEAEAAAYPEGDGLFRQPLMGGIDSIEAVPSKKELDKFHGAVVTPSGSVMVTQDGLSVYDAAKHVADNGKRWSLFSPILLPLGTEKVVVLESMDSKMAGRVFDITAKKPKVTEDLYKKHRVRAAAIDEAGSVWMILSKETRGKTSNQLAAVTVSGEHLGPYDLNDDDIWWQTKHLAVGNGCARVWFEESQTLLITGLPDAVLKA